MLPRPNKKPAVLKHLEPKLRQLEEREYRPQKGVAVFVSILTTVHSKQRHGRRVSRCLAIEVEAPEASWAMEVNVVS